MTVASASCSGSMGGLYSSSVRTQNSSTSSSTSNSTSGALCKPNRDTFERTPISALTAGSTDYVGIGFITPYAGTKTSTSTTSSSSLESPTSQLKSLTSARELTESEYDKLAAVIAGIETDIDGNHTCTYEETLKYGQIISNLHKYGITNKSTLEEAAAAAAGVDIEKNIPQIKSRVQGENYNKALINLRNELSSSEDVGSEAGLEADEAIVGSVVKNHGSLSMTLTGTYSNEFENYLRNLEKEYGTKWVFKNIFGGDITQYDPAGRASALTGIPLDKNGEPIRCGEDGENVFYNLLYGKYNFFEYGDNVLFWEISDNAILNNMFRNISTDLGEIFEWDYVLGTTTDCSGLTQYLYSKLGIDISHYSAVQSEELIEQGGYILDNPSIDNLRVGDLLTFDGHVGIYVGDGLFLHSTDRENVSLSPLYDIGADNYDPYTRHGVTSKGVPVTYANGYWGGKYSYSTPLLSVTRPKIP